MLLPGFFLRSHHVQPQAMGHVWPERATSATQYKIVNLLKHKGFSHFTWSYRSSVSFVGGIIESQCPKTQGISHVGQLSFLLAWCLQGMSCCISFLYFGLMDCLCWFLVIVFLHLPCVCFYYYSRAGPAGYCPTVLAARACTDCEPNLLLIHLCNTCLVASVFHWTSFL